MAVKIQAGFDNAGGFQARLENTHVAAYAYPTSAHAVNARRNPGRVARAMISDSIDYAPSFVEVCGYARMVERANGLPRITSGAVSVGYNPPITSI